MTAARGEFDPSPGDPRAWLQLHGDRLLRSAYLLCGNETDAEDLVQETLLQALKSAPRFRGGSTVYTWLHGILLNLCRRHWRTKHRLVFDENLVLQAPCDPPSEAEMDHELQAVRLARAVQALSPEHREVVVLRYYENLKIHEIAAQAGISVGTAKSRLHYAVRCLEKLVPGELNFFAAEGTQDQAVR